MILVGFCVFLIFGGVGDDVVVVVVVVCFFFKFGLFRLFRKNCLVVLLFRNFFIFIYIIFLVFLGKIGGGCFSILVRCDFEWFMYFVNVECVILLLFNYFVK